MSEVILETKGLKKIFRREGAPPLEVLRGVDFTVSAGDRIAILGKSGTGKSTFLHLLGTLEEPSDGKVYFRGQDIFNFNDTELSLFRNRELGFVFQFHYLMLEFTATENVIMPGLIGGMSKRSAKKRAEDLLSRVGLKERLDHKPSQLSGGEQQRVAIARSLMMEPKLLLTDEMTGNLDPATGAQVFELVQSIQSEFKMALVSVTHDHNMASTYQRVLKLESGILTSVS